MWAQDIITHGHPFLKCMDCIELPVEVKAHAQAKALAAQNTATFTQLAKRAQTLKLT